MNFSIRGSIFRQLSVNSTKADKFSILRIKLYSENLFMPRAQHGTFKSITQDIPIVYPCILSRNTFRFNLLKGKVFLISHRSTKPKP